MIHEGKVFVVDRPDVNEYSASFRYECSCGFKGSFRSSPKNAQIDGEQHEKDVFVEAYKLKIIKEVND